jgi:histidinol dehydrogenase
VNYLLERSNLSTASLAKTSWDAFGEAIVVQTLDEAYAIADEYASEHVEILTQNPREALQKMSNYGALFLGEKTCVSYGDKVCICKLLIIFGCFMLIALQVIGTNHVLPTRKASRYTGGLWVGKYLRTVSIDRKIRSR